MLSFAGVSDITLLFFAGISIFNIKGASKGHAVDRIIYKKQHDINILWQHNRVLWLQTTESL